MNPKKKKIAVFTASGCRGCEHAILNVHYQIQSLSRWIDFVFWPYLLGSGQMELDSLDEIDVCFFSGAVATAAQRGMAEQLRSKSGVMGFSRYDNQGRDHKPSRRTSARHYPGKRLSVGMQRRATTPGTTDLGTSAFPRFGRVTARLPG